VSVVTPEGAPTLQPIRGPSALAGDPRRFAHLTWTLAVQEFKLRFFGSVLGYLWQVMRPLMLFGVLYVVFTQFVDISDHKLYPASLLLGIVLYTFFAEATSGAVSSVVDREQLVRKIHFPRLAIPMAVVLTAGFNLLPNLLVVFVFGAALGISPAVSWLELPVLIAILTLFSIGIAALLSALYVRFRDLRPIWDVALQIVFYGSFIIVPFETVFERFPALSQALLWNPLAAIVQQARHAVIDSQLPSAAAAMGGTARLLIPLAIVAGFCALGLWVFDREAPRIAEDL
jgi:ABC-2 type transport system permease protein